MPMAGMEWARRRAPELALAVLAGAVFLGFLGAVDLWGKREQRAAAEALDTVDHGRWLVAQIQGRPRLEKPPLPRWTIATLVRLTGRRDEAIVRLPGALAALGMVALVYALGRRLGGRAVGLAAGLILSSSAFFISEVRQAGNDGPLAFFTTLALYAAWRRLHGGPAVDAPGGPPAAEPGARRWALLMYLALGLGFLTKGPVILVLVAVTVLPYLACAGRLRAGLRLLADGRGLLVLVALALCWPVPVALAEPKAIGVWYLEMAQKAGSAGLQQLKHQNDREILALDWFWMTAPWVAVALLAVALPLRRCGRGLRPTVWFPWWWAVGNLAMFCTWTVAKPNYYLPCLPGVALLTGIEWVRLSRAARAGPGTARGFLHLHWVALSVAAASLPAVVKQAAPAALGWATLGAVGLAAAVVASAWAWRRGADAGALVPLVGAAAVGVLVGYGAIAPAANPAHSHRALAATLERLLPPQARTVMFYHELDEGLWFYLRGRTLAPVPGSQPAFNDGYDFLEELEADPQLYSRRVRQHRQLQVLLDWIRRPDRSTPYVLIRGRVYEQFAPDLEGLATPLYSESRRGLSRNELVLLRLADPEKVAQSPGLRTE
jgi:4-amino-4-deoxy-L-arabinose transferase-like glycosyltransferase